MKNKKREYNLGFTLAELLITLAVVGVVAALTVTTLFANYQKKETETRVLKTFSVLSQTGYRAISDHGNVSGWEIKAGKNRNAAKNFADTYLLPYLKVAKKCENNNSKECKFTGTCLNGTKYSHDVTNDSKAYRFYLGDGTLVSLVAYLNNSTTGHNKLVTMAFDINGQKGPNKLGKDIFIIEYMVETFKYPEINGQMIPQYGNRSREEIISNKSNMCNKKQTGEACLALISKDNWEIKKDYPW